MPKFSVGDILILQETTICDLNLVVFYDLERQKYHCYKLIGLNGIKNRIYVYSKDIVEALCILL